MNDAKLTLRELFEVDPKQISARAETGINAYQAVDHIRREIQETSRAIRWPWVQNLVIERAAGILDLNVIDVLLEAWKKYMDIEKYADKSAGEPQLVELVSHTLKSEHHPYIEVLVKDHPVDRITFDLDFSLTLEGFVLKIQDGRILELQTGSCHGEGSLSLAGVALLKCEPKPLRFPGTIGFGRGIPLRSMSLPATA